MIDLALLGLRLWLGLVMVAHGVNHGRSIESTGEWFASKGFVHPALIARGSAAGEVAIGIGLALGALTSFAAAGLVTTMSIAFWVIHRHAGFFVFQRPDEGWEYVATLAVAALVVATIGPGGYSVDAALGWSPHLDGLTGLLIVGGGVLLAVVTLVAAWRKP